MWEPYRAVDGSDGDGDAATSHHFTTHNLLTRTAMIEPVGTTKAPVGTTEAPVWMPGTHRLGQARRGALPGPEQ